MWQDARHGLRMLAQSPGFAALAMLSIGIGVGANAAMFGVADTMVLRPLTMPRANELVTVTAVVPRAGFQSPSTRSLSYPDFLDTGPDRHADHHQPVGEERREAAGVPLDGSRRPAAA